MSSEMYKPMHLCVIDDDELMKNASKPSVPPPGKTPIYCRDFEHTSAAAADEEDEIEDYDDDDYDDDYDMGDDPDDHIDADYVTDIFLHFLLVCYSLYF